MKPTVYIETKWENRGSRYPQPIKYCNGKELTCEVIKNFEIIFNKEFGIASSESRAYNTALSYSKYDSELWKNDRARDNAFEKIYNFNLQGKGGTSGSVTPLLPFEIFLMNDGFEMKSFCELNALMPMYRTYVKGDVKINIAFGIIIDGRQTNFYFKTSKHPSEFQVDNNPENYTKAINGKLKPLW